MDNPNPKTHPTSNNSSNFPLPIETPNCPLDSNLSSPVEFVETLGVAISPSPTTPPKTLVGLPPPLEPEPGSGSGGDSDEIHTGEEQQPQQQRHGEECVMEDAQLGEEDVEDSSFGLSLSPVESGPTGVGAGLSNLGNTCFINAILQCFTHTVPLVKALCGSTHAVTCGSKEFCVLCTLHEHVELSMVSSGKIISPRKFFDNLNHISSFLRRYQQEDAHEFLQCFLDRLERCSLDSNSVEKGPSVHGNNLVEQIFGGRLVSKLLCSHCGHCSEKFEPLIDMSLEIEEVNTLESALESFTKVEKIEDSEVKFICENCKEEASMEKQLMLDKAPLVSALHLKRFKTDGFSVEKISKHVKFPLELDLKPYTNGHHDDSVELKYQLYAFVVHNGFLPTSGHYFCYVRSSPDTWHKFDDSQTNLLKQINKAIKQSLKPNDPLYAYTASKPSATQGQSEGRQIGSGRQCCFGGKKLLAEFKEKLSVLGGNYGVAYLNGG